MTLQYCLRARGPYNMLSVIVFGSESMTNFLWNWTLFCTMKGPWSWQGAVFILHSVVKSAKKCNLSKTKINIFWLFFPKTERLRRRDCLRSEEKILILVFEEVNCTTTTPNYISCCDTFFIFRALCSDITKALSRKKRRPSWRPTSVCWKKKFLLNSQFARTQIS